MLRISEVEPTDDSVILLLEGALRGEWLDELIRVSSSHQAAGRTVGLDLSGVSAVDANATDYLRTGVDVEFTIARASDLLTQLIETQPGSDGSE